MGSSHVDRLIYVWVVMHRERWLTPLMRGLSVVGRGGLVWIAIGLILAIPRWMPRRALGQLVLAILLASTCSDGVLKPLFARERPFASMTDVTIIGGRPQDASFPSGHSANAFASAYVLAHVMPAAAGGWWLLAASIAYSRIYLGVHYPADVAGGAIVGMLCGFAALRLVRSAGGP
jgi:undecaprenyl-diphosphatase